MIISLIGFMGCGKSSVGRRLSELLCCPFMDLDAAIEEQSGRTIPEIFATDGEYAFRQMELAALQNIVHTATPIISTTFAIHPSTPDLILSLGGGTVMTPECAALVHEQTMCIYLRTSVDTLVARLANEAADRPLLASCNTTPSETVPTSIITSEVKASTSQQTANLRHRIESLMSSRASTYERTAHHIIDTDGLSIDAVAKQIIAIL